MRLSERKISKLNKPGRYRDGNGLLLQVTKSGSKSWVFRFEKNGRERMMGLGPLHLFNLAQARRAARSARELLFLGVDPIESRLGARDAERADARSRLTFKEATEKFLELHSETWKSSKHAKQWESTLRVYAYPLLGSRPIAAIEDALINEALAPIWMRIPETTSRVRHRIKRVISWVKEGMPLPSQLAKRKSKNQPSMPHVDLPAFIVELRTKVGISAKALEFLILTAGRTGEVIGAKWNEIDVDKRLWTVPAERMKANREHRVPLCDRAIEILETLPREEGNDFVFIGGCAGKSLSNMAMLQLMRGMGAAGVVHGLRASFRTWAGECTNFPREVCEQALAHALKNRTEAAYARGDLFERRRKLMDAWARYCARGGNSYKNAVVTLHANVAA